MKTCFFCKEPEDFLGLKCGVCFGCAANREKDGVFDACLAGTFDPEAFVASGGKQAGTTVQTLIFDKEAFPTSQSAQSWALSHDFTADKVDETEGSFSIRQRQPNDFSGSGFGAGEQFRTVTLRAGVQAVIGFLTEEAEMAGPGKSQHTHVPLSDGSCRPGFRRLGNLCVRRGTQAEKDILEKGEVVERKAFLKIAIIDEAKQIVFGPVLVPNEADLGGDFEFREDIAEAAHGFMMNNGKIGEQHQVFQGIGNPVESHILRAPMVGAKGETLEVGTWFMGVKVENDATWARVLSGELNGFSIGFRGIRRRVG